VPWAPRIYGPRDEVTERQKQKAAAKKKNARETDNEWCESQPLSSSSGLTNASDNSVGKDESICISGDCVPVNDETEDDDEVDLFDLFERFDANVPISEDGEIIIVSSDVCSKLIRLLFYAQVIEGDGYWLLNDWSYARTYKLNTLRKPGFNKAIIPLVDENHVVYYCSGKPRSSLMVKLCQVLARRNNVSNIYYTMATSFEEYDYKALLFGFPRIDDKTRAEISNARWELKEEDVSKYLREFPDGFPPADGDYRKLALYHPFWMLFAQVARECGFSTEFIPWELKDRLVDRTCISDGFKSPDYIMVEGYSSVA
jgi:hypothetical protein